MLAEQKLVQKSKITGAKNYLYIVIPKVEAGNEDDIWEGSLKSLKNSFEKIIKEGHKNLENKVKGNKKQNEDEFKSIKGSI